MHQEIFHLNKNAFWILRAEYDTNQSEILDLAEEAELNDYHKLEDIQRSQQALLSPIARLAQEVSWLPELSAAQTVEVKSFLNSGRLNELLNAAAFFPEISKANILAHYCGDTEADDKVLQELIESWEDFDGSKLLNFLNYHRETSAFPKISEIQLQEAIKALVTAHARSAAISIWRVDKPGELMERFVEANLNKSQPSQILSELVREYDNLCEPRLSEISIAIDEQISIAQQERADLQLVIREIANLLRQWDEFNQPVQLFEQFLGHEEGRSKGIYEKLRSLCLELANTRAEFGHAKRLSEALLHTFPELESVAEVLKADVETLESLDDQKMQFAVLGPLVNACEAAKSHTSELKSGLQDSGFGWVQHKIVKNIFETFDAAAKSLGIGDPAFLVVKDLALFVNNDRNDPETAFRLIDGLINYSGPKPSQDLYRKLEEERSVLHRNWKMPELDNQSGNLSGISRILDDMLKYANGKDRAELIKLKSSIAQKRSSNRAKWLIFSGITVVIGFYIVYEELDRPSLRTPYQSTNNLQPSPEQQPARSNISNSTIEMMPPIGQGVLLNRSQVRYCIFQGERLDAMRSIAVTDYQVDRFNILIEDYNSRCSEFRYTSGVLSSVRREASERSAELIADARRIVASW